MILLSWFSILFANCDHYHIIGVDKQNSTPQALPSEKKITSYFPDTEVYKVKRP